MAASSAVDVFHRQKYDVFLSFRGLDTRCKFTSHLYAALRQQKIYTYIDDRLERGDEIEPALLTAIEQSKLSQGTYENAFAMLEDRFKDNMDKVRKWRQALTTAANLSGFHSQDIRLESDLTETIVKDISTKLNRNSSYTIKGLGTSTIEAIFLDVSKIQELQLSPAAFRSMPNLKLLKCYVPQEVHNEYKRQRRWTVGEKQQSSFPWLPGVKAVRSFLDKSRIWGSITLLDVYRKNLVSLKHLNLCDSRNLIEVPDLSGSPNIERIDLSGCSSLVGVPSCFQNLENLASLDLNWCWNLKFFCEIPCNLEVLNLSGTAIEEISPSIWSHKKLHTLDLSWCGNLKNLSSRSNSTTGELNSCGGDQNQIGLKILHLDYSNIESLPDNSIYGLDTLYLYGCKQLKRLPPLSMGSLCSWRSLDLSWCKVLESIPDSLFFSQSLCNIDSVVKIRF
ncbi:hypothetical protein M0R45_011377 [Rubus argutus]|uniref:TIR domain-containing protein n=1 Tax=Rubus argutus TaxID=59490 RepID=A0AAW1Y9Q0_RUBAR